MEFLDRLLESPRLPDRPKVLSLFGSSDPVGNAFRSRGLETQTLGKPQVWELLLDNRQQWDIVCATHSMDRFYETISPSGLELFSKWLRTHATVVVSSPRKSVIDPERNSIGPTSLPEPFKDFLFFSEVTLPSEELIPETLLLLSDQVLWDGEKWIDSTKMEVPEPSMHKKPPPTSRREGKRTFLLEDHTVLKIQAGNVDYFDLLEVNQEVTTLETLAQGTRKTLGIPSLLKVSRGKTLVMMSREAVVGQSLANALHPSGLLREETLRGIVEICQAYARHELFHNDIRPWNFLVSERGVSLIDYSGISAFDSDSRNLPQILALWGTLIFFTDCRAIVDSPDFSEQFDVTVLKQASNFLESRQIPLDTLYGNPWRQLAGRDPFSLTFQLANPEDLLARLLGL